MSWKPFAAVGGALTAVGSVATAFIDPTFLLSHPDIIFSLGFTVVKGGQELAPNLPWQKILLVLVTGSVLLTLARIHDMRTQEK